MTPGAETRFSKPVLPGDLEKKNNLRYRAHSGAVNLRPSWTYFPKNESEIAQIVAFAREQKMNLRPAGFGHAVQPFNESPTGLILLERMQGLVHVNPEQGEAIVWGGTNLDRLEKLLADQGLALGYPAEHSGHSLAGALGVGTHGSSRTEGILASKVTALTMVTGKGDIVVCSRDKNPDIFRAALLSLGTLGVITKVSMKLDRLSHVREEMSRVPVAEARQHIENPDTEATFSEFIYFPHTEELLTRRLFVEGAAQAAEARGREGFLKSIPARVLAGTSRFLPALSKPLAGVASSLYFRPQAQLANDHLLRDAFADGLLMEYGLPVDRCADALEQVRARFDSERVSFLLPVHVRFAAADDIYLSSANGRETCFLGLRAPEGQKGRELLNACEGILREHGGRPFWGGVFSQDQNFAEVFPGFESFQAVRRDLDPDEIFLNPTLKKIFG